MLAFIANCFQTDGVAQSLIPRARGRGRQGEEAVPLTDAYILEENVQDWGAGRWAITVVGLAEEKPQDFGKETGGGFERKEPTLEPQRMPPPPGSPLGLKPVWQGEFLL